MKLLRALLAVCLVLSCIPHIASAQAMVYGTFGFSDFGFTDRYTGDIYIYSDTVALSVGGVYLFPTASRNKYGIDARFEVSPGSRGGKAGTVAFRYNFIPETHRLRPYVQLGFGAVSTTANEPTTLYPNGAYLYQRQTLTSPAVGYAGGLDLHLNSSWDYKIFDLQEYVGVGKNPIASTVAFTTGAVYHF